MANPRHRVSTSFRIALSGLFYAFRTQPNLRIGLLFTLFALGLSFCLQLSLLELTLIVFGIILFFVAEMINTVIEETIDLVTPEWRRQAKVAKDVASGMVLVVVFGTLIIGFLVFGPKIMVRLGRNLL